MHFPNSCVMKYPQEYFLEEPKKNSNPLKQCLIYKLTINKIKIKLTLDTLSATPSGRFLWVYSKNVSAVEPVSLWKWMNRNHVLTSYWTLHFLWTWIDRNNVYLSWWALRGDQLKTKDIQLDRIKCASSELLIKLVIFFIRHTINDQAYLSFMYENVFVIAQYNNIYVHIKKGKIMNKTISGILLIISCQILW